MGRRTHVARHGHRDGAAAAGSHERQRQGRRGSRRDAQAPAGDLHAQRHDDAELDPGRRGRRLMPCRPILKPLEPYRGNFSVYHRPVPCPGRSPGRRRRRPWPLLRRLPDRRPCQEDRRRRHHRGHLDGPDRRQAVRRTRPRSRRWNWAWSLPAWWAAATAATAAPIPTPCPGRTPHTPLPVTINPREVFERLFGDGDSLDAKSRAGAAAPPGLDPGFRGPGRQAHVRQAGRHRQATSWTNT